MSRSWKNRSSTHTDNAVDPALVRNRSVTMVGPTFFNTLSCSLLTRIQLDKLKPLISLVDNMVKLGSSTSPRRTQKATVPATNTAVKRNLTPLLHQQQQHQHQQQSSPTYTNIQRRNYNNNNSTMVFHSTPQRASAEPFYDGGRIQHLQGWEEEQISELESKHHQLAQLEKFVREEGAAIGKLTRDQHVLRLAIRGVRQVRTINLALFFYFCALNPADSNTSASLLTGGEKGSFRIFWRFYCKTFHHLFR